jgi:RNA recognition motif-containing protein
MNLSMYIILSLAALAVLFVIFMIVRRRRGAADGAENGGDNSQIYVGNLPYRIHEDELRDHFSQFGAIEQVRIVKNRQTRKSMGFGFITFANTKAASNALGADGHEVQGRTLVVRIAKQR